MLQTLHRPARPRNVSQRLGAGVSTDIDLLFDTALATGLRAKGTTKKASSIPLSPRESYENPASWRQGRIIALIHADTETVLGTFQESFHSTGARRLSRIEGPCAISASERVEGSWWLGAERRPEPRRDWHEQRRCHVHLHLDILGLRSPAVEVVVHLAYGGIERVELAEETQFAAEGTLVWLPAGTNVLPVMSLDSKVATRIEMGERG